MKAVPQIVLAAATLAAIAGGIFLLVRDSPPRGSFEITLPTPASAGESRIMVYVTGAVDRPGVYTAQAGDRLAQVVEAAGGATDDADLSAVNLAIHVRDEDHWHIPRLGEAPEQPDVASGDAPQGSTKIDINTASARELESLPGIGEVKARAIISFREANGPFSSAADLLEVRGIGPATFETIAEFVEAR